MRGTVLYNKNTELGEMKIKKKTKYKYLVTGWCVCV
jgi:hypothetical protein